MNTNIKLCNVSFFVSFLHDNNTYKQLYIISLISQTSWLRSGSSRRWDTPTQGRSHNSGCPRPHTSVRRASLGLWGRNGPWCWTCSTAVSSLNIDWNWSTRIAETNMPNNALSNTRITQCRLKTYVVNRYLLCMSYAGLRAWGNVF
jgi:hypothetical protein